MERDRFNGMSRMERGLARCSKELIVQPANAEAKIEILRKALEHLQVGTDSSRITLFQNFHDPELGLRSESIAVASDPAFEQNDEPPWSHNVPLSSVPARAINALESGKPIGGIVEEVFESNQDFMGALQIEGVSTFQFFPIQFADRWWGYLGFYQLRVARRWHEAELMLFGTAAEIFASAIQRWEAEESFKKQQRHEEALLFCSRILHQLAYSRSDRTNALNQALEQLRLAVRADRAYLFENFDDPELGFCIRMRAEVCEPGVSPQIDNESNQRFPWSDLPPEMRLALEREKPYGGLSDQAFRSTPRLLAVLKNQPQPIQSIQIFPVHFGKQWWGFIGYDDVEKPREWSPDEIRILRIASEMIGNTLRRWQTESALKQELAERRQREERLRLLESVVVNTSESIIITEGELIDSPGPRILYVNEAFSRNTGYEPDEIIGQSPRVLQGPRTSRRELDRLRLALENGEPVDIELINYRKDGSEFWVEMSIGPVLDSDGTCTHFVAVQRDVTERKQSEEAIRTARDDLEIRVAERTSELTQINERLRQEIAYRRQAETEVKKRLSIEQTLGEISTRLVSEADPRVILPAVLHDVALMVNARRVALVFLDVGGTGVSEIYEWRSPSTPPLDNTVLSDLMPNFIWIRQQMEERQPLFLENLSQMPTAAISEKQIIQKMGTESVALFPIQVDGRLEAVFVCSNFNFEGSQLTQQLDILNVVADLLSTNLQRAALINSLEERAIDRSRELAAFYDMTMLAGEKENISDILEPALTHILEVARCDGICIHELSEDGSVLSLVAQLGWEPDENGQINLATNNFGYWFLDQNDPIIELSLNEAEWLPAALRPAGFDIYLAAQLRARGKAIGILSCYRRGDRPYSVNTTALVVALAEQLGTIIENYRLRQQAEEGAIIEERQRLARDLHDAITQSLYGLSLFARSGVDALDAGNLDKVNQVLNEVELNALQALKEMRLLLHQLRPLALEQGGLGQAIESRLSQVERRLGISANIVFDKSFNLRPRAEEALYRIVTEALNNSLKYANASNVDVIFTVKRDKIHLEVKDDGGGFDPEKTRSGMGLQNMYDRVAAMGGKLTLNSSPESGTLAVIEIPAEWMEQ